MPLEKSTHIPLKSQLQHDTHGAKNIIRPYDNKLLEQTLTMQVLQRHGRASWTNKHSAFYTS